MLISSFDLVWPKAQELTPAAFVIDIHRDAFTAIMKCLDQGRVVNWINVQERMISPRAGLWFDDVLRKTAAPESIDLGNQIKAMQDLFEARRLAEYIRQESTQIKTAGQRLADLSELIRGFGTKKQADQNLARHILEGIYSKLAEGPNSLDESIPTPWAAFNDILAGGMRPGEMMVCAGRPGMGKSALGLSLARSVAEQRRRVLYVSLEMSGAQLGQRLLSQITGIPGHKIRRHDLTMPEIDRVRKAVQGFDFPLEMNDQIRTLDQIRSELQGADIEGRPFQFAVIDYLQLLGTDQESENRQIEVAKMSRKIKLLSIEMKLPILILAQLNRGVESRKDKRPFLSDLRESGAIEQDADQVLFCYRDHVYNDLADQKAFELILAKHRHGPTGSIDLEWCPETIEIKEKYEPIKR